MNAMIGFRTSCPARDPAPTSGPNLIRVLPVRYTGDRKEGERSMDRDKEDRLRRYQDAYEQAVSEDSPENRGLYRAIYREAWDRRECMLCAEPMTMPNTHQLLREDRSPAATRFIAHERCFELMAAGQGFEIVRREPSGVDSDDGALVSETVLERPHHDPADSA